MKVLKKQTTDEGQVTQKILVIEGDPEYQELLRFILDEDYDLIIAKDDVDGLKLASEAEPHLVILDSQIGGMGAEQVGYYLRADPLTAEVGILMLVTEEELEHIDIGADTSADDFLIKPFTAAELMSKVLPIIGDEVEEEKRTISSGNGELDNKMGGGVPIGSLTLIEGSSGAGKSVLTQQMIWGSLYDGFTLSIFTSENTVKSLVKQMRSLSLDILDFLLLGKFRIFPMEVARLGKDALPLIAQALRNEVWKRDRDMVFVDSLTSAISNATVEEILGFFEQIKRLCVDRKTLLVVLHSHALTQELIVRIRSLCDAHLQLRTEEAGNRLVKTLEVTKIRGADKKTGNIVSFEVEPGWGMRIIPISKVKG